jgi:hypothetical protein
LAYAILRAKASLQITISVTIIGEYEGAETNISVGEVVCIRNLADSRSVIALLSLFLFCLGILCLLFAGSVRFSLSVCAGVTLWSVAGGRLEVISLILLHGGSSNGAFISASSGGVVVISSSEITSGCVYGGANGYYLCSCS